MKDIAAEQIVWSAYVADGYSGCYSTPRQVRVSQISESGMVYVQEKVSTGWSHWHSLRRQSELFATEKEGWLYLASNYPADGLGGTFARLAEDCGG